MRRYGVGLALVLLSASVWASSASGVNVGRSLVLHFYEGPAARVFVDNPPKGSNPSIGDVFIYRYPVYTRQGHGVGSQHEVCTVIGSLAFLCTGTLQLPNGQLMLQRAGTATAGNVEAVVGGTGAFVGARGLLTAHSSGQHTTIDITLQ